VGTVRIVLWPARGHRHGSTSVSSPQRGHRRLPRSLRADRRRSKSQPSTTFALTKPTASRCGFHCCDCDGPLAVTTAAAHVIDDVDSSASSHLLPSPMVFSLPIWHTCTLILGTGISMTLVRSEIHTRNEVTSFSLTPDPNPQVRSERI
jgi:hypothetical protein